MLARVKQIATVCGNGTFTMMADRAALKCAAGALAEGPAHGPLAFA
jgi:hypothetical protein